MSARDLCQSDDSGEETGRRMHTSGVLRRGFSLLEILIVLAIISILLAILFPVFAAARNRAKMTACQANLYQYSRGGQIDNTNAQQDVSRCPYPQGDDSGDYINVSSLYETRDPSYQPDAGTVMAYCVEHLKKGSDGNFKVPLEGKFPVVRFGHGTSLVDAKAVTRWRMQGSNWVQIPETGQVPGYPEIWHFPRDDFPPR